MSCRLDERKTEEEILTENELLHGKGMPGWQHWWWSRTVTRNKQQKKQLKRAGAYQVFIWTIKFWKNHTGFKYAWSVESTQVGTGGKCTVTMYIVQLIKHSWWATTGGTEYQVQLGIRTLQHCWNSVVLHSLSALCTLFTEGYHQKSSHIFLIFSYTYQKKWASSS